MNLPKAIEILSITLEVKGRLGKDDEHDAIRLGIEALKRHTLRREHPKRKFPYLLVGETED